jgi:hypothetical protein
MMERATVAERIVFGRPIDTTEDQSIHLAPRPMTALLGRIALASIFLVSGTAKLVDVAGAQAKHRSNGEKQGNKQFGHLWSPLDTAHSRAPRL